MFNGSIELATYWDRTFFAASERDARNLKLDSASRMDSLRVEIWPPPPKLASAPFTVLVEIGAAVAVSACVKTTAAFAWRPTPRNFRFGSTADGDNPNDAAAAAAGEAYEADERDGAMAASSTNEYKKQIAADPSKMVAHAGGSI